MNTTLTNKIRIFGNFEDLLVLIPIGIFILLCKFTKTVKMESNTAKNVFLKLFEPPLPSKRDMRGQIGLCCFKLLFL